MKNRMTPVRPMRHQLTVDITKGSYVGTETNGTTLYAGIKVGSKALVL